MCEAGDTVLPIIASLPTGGSESSHRAVGWGGQIQKCKVIRRMQALYGPNGICDLFPNTGHKTASASQRVLPDTWRSRKLMASVNGTQTAKNCTDPGKKSIPPHSLPQGIWPRDAVSVDITARAEKGGLMNLSGEG